VVASLLLVAALILVPGLWWKDELVGEATLLGLPVVRSSHTGNDPFADVPVTHWSYASVAGLQRSGLFSGFPDGTFERGRPITRYEFAIALLRLSAEAPRTPTLNGLSRREACRRIALLSREYAPELGMLGSDVTATIKVLNRSTLPGQRPAARPHPANSGDSAGPSSVP
jgi:hypothetical protein